MNTQEALEFFEDIFGKTSQAQASVKALQEFQKDAKENGADFSFEIATGVAIIMTASNVNYALTIHAPNKQNKCFTVLLNSTGEIDQSTLNIISNAIICADKLICNLNLFLDLSKKAK